MESDPALEGELQTTWDRFLSRKPVLLILIGSDLAMMEKLDDYKRPFHQRAAVMVLPPLNPAEVGDLAGRGPASVPGQASRPSSLAMTGGRSRPSAPGGTGSIIRRWTSWPRTTSAAPASRSRAASSGTRRSLRPARVQRPGQGHPLRARRERPDRTPGRHSHRRESRRSPGPLPRPSRHPDRLAAGLVTLVINC